MIEWDDDVDTLVRARTPNHAPATHHKIITIVLAVLSAIVFATWGIRHLRAAS